MSKAKLDAPAEERLKAARVAFAALHERERAVLFAEFGLCGCAQLGTLVARHPRAAVGALIGAVAVEALAAVAAPTPTPPKPAALPPPMSLADLLAGYGSDGK